MSCADSYEVPSWVASWMEHVEVLEPVKLREQLARLGAAYTARYGKAPAEAALPTIGEPPLRYGLYAT